MGSSMDKAASHNGSWTVVNDTRGETLATRGKEARTFAARFVGWMGRAHIEPGEALHIVPCTGVHTFFMRTAIDVVILSPDGVVLDVVSPLKPWRVTRVFHEAKSVLELPPGKAAAVQRGDRLRFIPPSGA